MPTWWAKEYVPFFVCVVTSAFTIGGLLFLRESWRSGMFMQARAAIATAFRCWKSRRENPVYLYGTRKIFSVAGVLVLLIALLNVVGTWVYMEGLSSRYPGYVPRGGLPNSLAIFMANSKWVWLSISISAVLFCAVFDRWRDRLDELRVTPLSFAEITFGRFYRACVLTFCLWVLAGVASTVGIQQALALRPDSHIGAQVYLVRLMAWNFLAANVSLVAAIRLQLAGRSILSSLVVTPFVTYLFALLGGLIEYLSSGFDSTQLVTPIRGAALNYMIGLNGVRGIAISSVAFFAVLQAMLWSRKPKDHLREPQRIRRLAAIVRSWLGWGILPKAAQFGAIMFLAYLLIGMPVRWSVLLVYQWIPIAEFVNTPWSCLRGFSVAGVILIWFARKKCSGAGPGEEGREFAKIACAFVTVAALTVFYHASLGFTGRTIFYANVMAFTCALALLPMLHVAGSRRPNLALAGWLLAAPWLEMLKPIMSVFGSWERRGAQLDFHQWAGVLAIALLLALRLAERWGPHEVARESMDASAATASA